VTQFLQAGHDGPLVPLDRPRGNAGKARGADAGPGAVNVGTSPEKLGEEQEELVTKLRETLERDARDGNVTEIVESEALLGFRSPLV